MSSFFQIFANQALGEILCFFLMHPSQEFYQSNIAKETGKALIQVQRTLKTLEQTGLISSEKRGRMIYYRAIPSHPAFEDLKKAFIKTICLGDFLREAVDKYRKKIDFAWVFGSVARGEENKESDLDIILVSNLSLKQISPIVDHLLKHLKRELNAVFIRPDDLIKKFHQNDSFIKEIISKPKIWILGDDHELERLLKKSRS